MNRVRWDSLLAQLEDTVRHEKERYHYRLYQSMLGDRVNTDGGSGSGNWGHVGNPPNRGGSKGGGGVNNRIDLPNGSHTSISKEEEKAEHGAGQNSAYQKWSLELRKPHPLSVKELDSLPAGSVVTVSHDKVKDEIVKLPDGSFLYHGGEQYKSEWLSAAEAKKQTVKISIPQISEKKAGSGETPRLSPDNTETYEPDAPLSAKQLESVPPGSVYEVYDESGKGHRFQMQANGKYRELDTGSKADLEATIVQAYQSKDAFEAYLDMPAEAAGGIEETFARIRLEEQAARERQITLPKDRIPDELRARMEHTKRLSDPKEVDGILRKDTEKVWNDLSDNEKYELYRYTFVTSGRVNRQLRGIQRNADNDMSGCISEITSAINRSSLPQDIWLHRGVSMEAVESMFHIPPADLFDAAEDEAIGRMYRDVTGKDNGFMSCGSAENTGFTDTPVRLHIFAPKGTKALYVEPFSYYGRGSGGDWDGSEKQDRFGTELETIINRGSTVTIDRIYTDEHYTINMDLCLREQDDVSGGSAG